ncbi:uncharacterized protein LOC121860421 [Homarus americanus]|uniref:uncharacterized protein LOC121860421 n=1 Tax=Homarus americanus TaxID=6706 RepID=UPI001C44B1AD|nr:uncharacterized protein LOC121860421 [Homarus americanus]
MSVGPFLLSRPVNSLQNTIVFPLMTAGMDGQETLRGFVNFLMPIHIIIDSFVEDLQLGRSYSEDQIGVYESLASRLTSQFRLEGRACILRFICELQQRPIGRWTLTGHLISLLFTPQVGKKDGDAEMLKEYLVAQILGKKNNFDCSSLYGSCPFSAFNYFEFIRNTTAALNSSGEENLQML